MHLITEPKGTFAELLRAVRQAVEGGVDWVQLRDKSASASSMYRQALALTPSPAASGEGWGEGTRLSINDRLDVALACGARAVHLAAQSLPVTAARSIAGNLIVGRSVHSLDEARVAVQDGADYVTFGHVFPSTSKPGLEPRGIAQLAEIVQAVDVPVLAIGGINLANLDQVLATGCAGIAVISAILAASDPGQASAELRRALDGSPHQPRHSFISLEDAHALNRQPTTV
ncbi:MAG: thiamine phosphate synthase [Chloroflexota bacterium]